MLYKRAGIRSIATHSLTRSFSSSRSSSLIRKKKEPFFPIKPESLALEHIHSGKSTSSSILNKILLNQNLLVTNSKLTQLLNVKGVELGSVWVKKRNFFHPNLHLHFVRSYHI